MNSHYTIIYLENPLTAERLNVGLAVWRIEPELCPVPGTLLYYFRRDWNRIDTVFGNGDRWKHVIEDLEANWKLEELLHEIRRPIGPYTWLRFTEPHVSLLPPMETLGQVGRYYFSKNDAVLA